MLGSRPSLQKLAFCYTYSDFVMSFLVLDYMAMVLQPQDLESLWNLAFMIYK